MMKPESKSRSIQVLESSIPIEALSDQGSYNQSKYSTPPTPSFLYSNGNEYNFT